MCVRVPVCFCSSRGLLSLSTRFCNPFTKLARRGVSRRSAPPVIRSKSRRGFESSYSQRGRERERERAGGGGGGALFTPGRRPHDRRRRRGGRWETDWRTERSFYYPGEVVPWQAHTQIHTNTHNSHSLPATQDLSRLGSSDFRNFFFFSFFFFFFVLLLRAYTKFSPEFLYPSTFPQPLLLPHFYLNPNYFIRSSTTSCLFTRRLPLFQDKRNVYFCLFIFLHQDRRILLMDQYNY